MQYNGFSNLELFWTKVWKVGFKGGWNSFQVKWGLTEGWCSSGWKIMIHIFNLVLTNHNKG